MDIAARKTMRLTELLFTARPLSLRLIVIWCWLNVLAMIPTLGDPVIVLFGFGAFGSSALMLKLLIFANAVAMSIALGLRLHPGRIAVTGFLFFALLNAFATDIVPSCPHPVKLAAYRQVLFGGLIPYLYVTLMPAASFTPMHLINSAATALIVLKLRQYQPTFAWRARAGVARASAG